MEWFLKERKFGAMSFVEESVGSCEERRNCVGENGDVERWSENC